MLQDKHVHTFYVMLLMSSQQQHAQLPFIARYCEQMSLPILYYMYMPHDGIPGSLMEEDCSLCVRLEVISIWTSRFLPLFYRIHLSSLGQGFQVG